MAIVIVGYSLARYLIEIKAIAIILMQPSLEESSSSYLNE